MTAIRASLAIWKREDQCFVELFAAQAENKTHCQPFQSDKKLTHMYNERITWVGNLTDLLFSFTMTNVSFEDVRKFYLLVCFEEYVEPYKAIFVFTSSHLEVQGNYTPSHVFFESCSALITVIRLSDQHVLLQAILSLNCISVVLQYFHHSYSVLFILSFNGINWHARNCDTE